MPNDAPPLAITKELSANDTGHTGGHQAGILIPKNSRILSFFPKLGTESKNPRHYLVCLRQRRAAMGVRVHLLQQQIF